MYVVHREERQATNSEFPASCPLFMKAIHNPYPNGSGPFVYIDISAQLRLKNLSALKTYISESPLKKFWQGTLKI